MKRMRVLVNWAAAVVVTVGAGSIVQTQFNLAAIEALGAEVGLSERLATTWHDLLSFAPLYAVPVVVAFAVAWPIAARLARGNRHRRWWLFPAAGFAAVLATILLMNAALPITAIGATRELSGTLGLAAAGAAAGWLYARLSESGRGDGRHDGTGYAQSW